MIIVERRAPTRQAAAKPPAAHQQRHLKGRRREDQLAKLGIYAFLMECEHGSD